MSATMEYHRYAKQYPELGTGPVPIGPYTSREFFDKERTAIFARCWLNVGRVEELPVAGSFLVKDIGVCNTSLLLVRGKDNVIRGFHNVCTHRGNTLVTEPCGRKSLFVCKFHCWSYDDQGCLRRVTDEKNFYDLDKDTLGLTPISTDVWEGFIFICFKPEQSLTEYLGGMGEALCGYPFDRIAQRFTYHADEQVNWKVLLDAQQEGYHVPYLHQRTISASFRKEDFRTKRFQTYGPHHLFSTLPSAMFEPTAVGSIMGKFGSTTTDSYSGNNVSDMGESRVIDGPLMFCSIFPNFVLGLSYGNYFSYNIWPVAVDRTLWEVNLCYPIPRKASQMFCNEYGKCFTRDTLLEDGSTHERVQRGLMSGAIDHLQLQDEEILARHSHKVVCEMVEAHG